MRLRCGKGYSFCCDYTLEMHRYVSVWTGVIVEAATDR